MKKSLMFILALVATFNITLQAGTVLTDSWSNVVSGKCSDQTAGWWSSAEAIRITNNVLLYQKDCGGWTKNINMQLVLTEAQKTALIADKPKNTAACIDNGAVTYELLYLSRVHAASTDDAFKATVKDAFTKGIQYLIDAQYANGGWPQYYPIKSGYYQHITYNDNAMINVMNILRRIYNKDSYYSITLSDEMCTKAKTAFDKGLDCILKTQYVKKYQLTSWCAQHHYVTMLPAQARAYELPSLSGSEAANIVNLLITLDNPSIEIKRAIHNAASWFDESRIKGIKVVSFTNSDGLADKKVVADATAPDLWARFYDLDTNLPFFCGRDGIKKSTMAEIELERRTGYTWYVSAGAGVINNYNSWLLTKGGSTIITSPVPNSTILSTDAVPFKALANKSKGSNLVSFEYVMDSEAAKSYTTTSINEAISGLAAGSHTVTVKATYENGSTETDAISFVVAASNSISDVDVDSSKLSCYPNPATTGFTIDLQDATIATVKIYNSQGGMVYQTTATSNSVYVAKNDFPTGIYFVYVTDKEDKLHIQKVVIQ